MNSAIWWIRRDLRLTDNQALTGALGQADQVIPLFIFDPRLLASPYAGEKRLAFLWGGLRQLDAALRERGSRLIIRRGQPEEILPTLLADSRAEGIFAEKDYSPYAKARDAMLAKSLPLTLVEGLTVRPPTTVLKDDGDPYIVYTPYSKTWKSHPYPTVDEILPTPKTIPTPPDLKSDEISAEPELSESIPFPPGEAEARRRLYIFTQGKEAPIYTYADRRDRPDLNGTSQLSPYLRFGMLSARQAVVAAWQARANAPNRVARDSAETWLNELIWREFYVAILHHFPHVRRGNFRSDYDGIAWNEDDDDFTAWCEGRTGYPIVDAAMRQLKQSGWMHNRARMIVASFLVKDLLIDWRKGERWFMQHLVDGDPAANNGGWQWAAGTGTDAAPYFRIFNPTLQSKKFDPDGHYIRRWVPELANVPTKYIHEPGKMSPSQQRQTGCVLGQDYPKPVVDHPEARKRTLEAYKQAKEGIRQ